MRRAVHEAGFASEKILTCDTFSGWFLAILRTAMGINSAHGAVTRPVAAPATRLPGNRSRLVEHTYRLAMVLVGGGAMADALAAGQAWEG